MNIDLGTAKEQLEKNIQQQKQRHSEILAKMAAKEKQCTL